MNGLLLGLTNGTSCPARRCISWPTCSPCPGYAAWVRPRAAQQALGRVLARRQPACGVAHQPDRLIEPDCFSQAQVAARHVGLRTGPPDHGQPTLNRLRTMASRPAGSTASSGTRIDAAYLIIVGGFLVSCASWWNGLVAVIWPAVQTTPIQREEGLLVQDAQHQRCAQ